MYKFNKNNKFKNTEIENKNIQTKIETISCICESNNFDLIYFENNYIKKII